MKPSSTKPYTYNEAPIPACGCFDAEVNYKGQQVVLPLTVVKGAGPSLLGRDWLKSLVIDWKSIHAIAVHESSLQALLRRYSNVFREGLGTLKGFKATVHVRPDARPKFCRPRTVPYAFRESVNVELDRLVQEGILELVDVAVWAAPIVTVLKKDKSSICICGDFRLTVNPVSRLASYLIPRAEDIFATLGKGRLFTKIDLRHAYQQLLLDNKSKDYLVINTQKRLFRYTRLPFGVSSALGIFQGVMESLLRGIKRVAVYLDDILISGTSEEEHLATLEEVLSRIQEAGLRMKLCKCEFMQSSVSYLGHIITEQGLQTLPAKVEAIQKAPTPLNVHQLKSYLGLLTYYNRFLPNMSSTLAPLYTLLRKDQPWIWTGEQQRAFDQSRIGVLQHPKF